MGTTQARGRTRELRERTRDAEEVQPVTVQPDKLLRAASAADDTDWQDSAERMASAIRTVKDQLGELDSEPEINIFRLNGRDRDFCDAWRVGEFDGQESVLKRIRDALGPGRYYLYLRNPTAPGMLFSRVVSVAPDPGAPPVNGKRHPLGELDDLAERFERGQQQLGQQLAAALQTLAQAMAGQRDTELGMLDKLKAYREIFAAPPALPAPAAADTTKALGQVVELVNLAKTLVPGQAPENATPMDAIVRLIDQWGPVLAEAISKTQPAPGARPAAPGAPLPVPVGRAAVGHMPPTGAAAPVPAQPAPPAAESDEDAEMKNVRALLQVLRNAAENEGDPHFYADILVDQIGTEWADQLLAVSDPVAQVCALDPSLGAYRAWLQQVIEHARTIVAEAKNPASADADPGGQGGGS